MAEPPWTYQSRLRLPYGRPRIRQSSSTRGLYRIHSTLDGKLLLPHPLHGRGVVLPWQLAVLQIPSPLLRPCCWSTLTGRTKETKTPATPYQPWCKVEAIDDGGYNSTEAPRESYAREWGQGGQRGLEWTPSFLQQGRPRAAPSTVCSALADHPTHPRARGCGGGGYKLHPFSGGFDDPVKPLAVGGDDVCTTSTGTGRSRRRRRHEAAGRLVLGRPRRTKTS